MIHLKKTALFTFFSAMSFFASAQNSPIEPTYDCTASETKQYIEQVSYNVFAPSPLSSPAQFKDAFIQREQEAAAQGDAGSESCVTIFTDGQLLDDWKKAVDAIKNLDINIDFTSVNGAALKAALAKARKMAQEQLTAALKALGEDICKLMSTDHLKGVLLSNVNKKFGTNARNLRVSDFAKIVKDNALDNASDNVQLLISPEDIDDEMNDRARSELKKTRRDLWDKF